MIKIRKNVFETNSSSSHCLVYSRKNPDRYEPKLETEDGILTIHFRTYGWTGPEDAFGNTLDILSTANDKLDYVMTYLCRWKGYTPEGDDRYWYSLEECEKMVEDGQLEKDEDVEYLLSNIKSNCPEIKEIKFELNTDSYNPFGYIDHESNDLLSGENLLNIIFNKGILILITNDNSDYYQIFDDTLPAGNCQKTGWGGIYQVYNITEKDFEE